MNWKKALLVIVVGIFALVLFAVAAAGVAATAGLATAAAVISESGVVEAFEDVADGAERIQIELEDNSVTFINPDSGESRTITANERFGRGRVQFDLPEVTVSDGDGETVVFSPGWYVEDGVRLPEITITDPDSGQSRVIIPDTDRSDMDVRVPRVVWEGDYHWFDGPAVGLRVVGGIFRGLFTLAALALIAAGAFLLLRNRRQDQLKQVEKDA